ncbi:MAG TPA: TraR/DksA family transcriptional regulator [Kofleriaceae bacterium]|jgi:DnaK suppressor protein
MKLSTKDVDRLRHVMIEKRDALRAAQKSMSPTERAVGDAEVEIGDMAERVVEQDSALQLGAFDAKLLGEVEHALAKIDTGKYGLSEDSGVEIPLPRLEAIPWARRTAEEESKRSR